jgi:hypothetical protein
MQRLSRLLPSLRVSHLVAGLACVICFVAGYLLAGVPAADLLARIILSQERMRSQAAR